MRNRLILWIALLTSCVSLYGATPIMLVSETDTAYYETFPDALKEANKLPSARLTLLDDVSFEGKAAVQTIMTNLSIDLNGYTLGDSLTSDRLFSLAIDSLTLRIFSSRPNGRIRMAAKRNGSIYAVYCTKGRLEIEDITIEGSNTAEDAAAYPNAGARGVYVGAYSTLAMNHCDISLESHGVANTLFAAGNAKSAGRMDVRNCRFTIRAVKGSSAVYCFSALTMDSCELDVQTELNAYGINMQAYNKDLHWTDTARVTNTRMTAVSSTKGAYGIQSKGHLYLANDSLYAQTTYENCYALYMTQDSMSCSAVNCSFIANCSFNVETGFVHAYGAYIYRGHLTASDCSFSATGRQSVWCLYVNRSTQADIVNCTITAEGREGASGIYAAGDATSKSHIHIRGCEINSRAKTKVYGIQLYCKGQIANCKMNVQADSSAYGVYATYTCDTVDIRGCYLKVNASKDYGPVNRLSSLVGRLTIQSGFYTDDTNLKMYLPSDTCGVYRLRSGVEFNQGYRYTIRDAENPGLSVAAVYDAEKVSLIGRFNSLTDALTYISYDLSKTYTIVLTSDLRLGPATYRIPANATLVVPYMEDQKEAMGIRPRRAAAVSYLKPYEYVRLTLKEGAHLLVEGALEVSGVQKTTYEYQGCVSSDYGYGRIHMLPGSSITLADNARLHAWGYITGLGTITAQAGSAVYELLQIGEWKGGTVIYQMINNPKRVYPLTHFFYQNIESPITYLAGAKAFGSAYVSVQGASLACDNIRLISDQDALFIMRDSTNASVSKVYDPLTDRVTWATNGDAALSELSIILKMGTMDFSLYSSQYILPVSTYMTIRAESGTLTIEHDVSLLPGAQVEVAPGAQAIIPQNTKLYVYDIDDWGTWAGQKQSTINYSPSWTICPRDTMQPSARMIIGGELTVEGSLYTTEHNAEILGTDEADGQIFFVNPPRQQDSIYQVTGGGFDFVYTGAALNPAMLMNADSTFVATQGIKAGALFTYQDGHWTCPPGSFEGIENTSSSTPSGRLILQNGQLFILLPDSQRFSLLGQKW